MKGTIQTYTYSVIPVEFKNIVELEEMINVLYDRIVSFHLNSGSLYKRAGKYKNVYELDIYPELDDLINSENKKSKDEQIDLKREYNFVIHLPRAIGIYTKKHQINQVKFDAYMNDIKKIKSNQIKEIINSFKSGFDSRFKLNNDYASRIRFTSEYGIETIFTDIEVVKLCNRLASPFIRKLLRNSHDNIKLLHQAAMKCFDKYGGYIITFLMRLPQLNFGNSHANEANISIDSFDGSLFSFNIKVGLGGPVYNFLFHPNFKNSKNEVLTIRNATREVIQGYLSLDGYYNNRLNNERLNPLIFIDNILKGNQTVYAGIHDGNCLNCGRPLQDPTSLRIGYGPSCAENLGIRH